MRPFLTYTEPMGIYQMLYAFMEACGKYMGDAGTHPWSQGFPLTSQLPDGPPLPKQITVNPSDLKYPKAWGHDSLRSIIAQYYQNHYQARVAPENVMIFAGGRAALFTVMFLLERNIEILVEETEYTPYFDLLRNLQRQVQIVPSNEQNGFRPTIADYAAASSSSNRLALRSNPCNPTGQVLSGEQLREFVNFASTANTGALIDEAYEFFVTPSPVSALAHIADINQTNIFVVGAATKGLQAPGIRIGWVIASQDNIKTLANYSTFGMGGVSRLSQLYAEALFEPQRVVQARQAVSHFYSEQRNRYGEALSEMGIQLFTGKGGFYHWGKLPRGMTADIFNERLFRQQAAILPGRLCDMHRRESKSPLQSFFRFSFGPLAKESFVEDITLLRNALEQ